MRAFQYSFQKVLDLKSNTKRQSEWFLAEAIGELQSAEQSLNRLKQERQKAADLLQGLVEQCTSAKELQRMQQYQDYLDEQILVANSNVRSAEQHVRLKQSELEQKMIDEKVWTKAKEKAETIYKQELAVAEQYEMDEMATVRYHMATR